ncbi:MAG: PQQ-binding-like beta-propeller repeat protein, partial [Limisphaerales bacterium]
MRSLAILSLILVVSVNVGADDWPIYRGPNHNGISQETGWKSAWTNPPEILWRAKVGMGHSSFSVAKGKVYTLGNSANQDTVYCFDAGSGKQIWKHTYPADKGAKFYPGGTHSTPTVDPATDTVYVLGKQGQLHALDAADGSVKWFKNVVRELGLGRRDIGTWGLGGSPLIIGERLYLNAGAGGACFNKKDGRVIWRSRGKSGFSTPLPYSAGGKQALAFFTARSVTGVDAQSGRPLWSFPWTTQYDVNAVDPVFTSGNTLFISSAYNVGGGMYAIRQTTGRSVWRNKNMINHFNSCVYLDGHLYGIHGHADKTRGELRCLEARSGRVVWSERSVGLGSLMVADGKLVIISEMGTLMIADASPKGFRTSGRMQALGPKCWAAPVLANGLVYV